MFSLNEAILNRQYMPYVSRAKAYGGPKLLQAVGPALLTKNWKQNSIDIRDALIARFGRTVALEAAINEAHSFAFNQIELGPIVQERYKEIYDQTATA